MNSPNAILKSVGEGSFGQPEGPAGRTSFLWVVIGLVIVGISGFYFLRRLNRLEIQVARLSKQIEQTNQGLQQIGEKSDEALHHASQAEANAQQAAQLRDQAEKAQAKSEEEAGVAKQQAQAARNEATLAQQKAEEYRKQREEELDRLQKVLNQIADTRRTAMGLIMTLGSNSIRFDFDKSDLRPENREVLSRIAGVLITLKGYSIYVYGYTDDIGTQEYNLKLSERRAQAVRDYLVKAGLDPSIISTKGFGKSDPRVRGDSDAARAINRRVEIGIVDSRLRFDEVTPPGK
jgi:outer membrane protein OmpA-like peptidoglycan-associated protein